MMYTINDIPEQHSNIRSNVADALACHEKIIGIIENNYYFTVVTINGGGVITLHQSLKGLDRCGTILLDRTDLDKLIQAIKKAAQCDNTKAV